jgi:hypothetical protein
LSSLPPDVEVPLPLGFDFIEFPVVGAEPGVAELAAGSPVVAPRPLGPPALCASARLVDNTTADAASKAVSFICPILLMTKETNPSERLGSASSPGTLLRIC